MHRYFLIILTLTLLTLPLPAAAADTSDDTMLMLIGEAEPVTTVASRQPESPITAPAMVTLVDREQIERHGWRTLGELLADQTGFFVATGGRGSVPYLRGLRDAILFLYDGVPITTDVTKSFAPLDSEFSLAAIDRVEIITGPGSVLWGVDAFAAVVNLVPARGHQRPDAELALRAGSHDLAGGRVSWAHQDGPLALFMNAAGNRQLFHQDRYQTDNQTFAELDPSRATELVGTLQYADWLHLSGRWSDFERNFTMQDATSGLIWDGSKETPFNYLKIAVNGQRGASHYSLNGFLQQTDYQLRDADVERRQRNRTSQLELLWDRRVKRRGLVTLGTSWRHNQVDNALVRDGFLPEFLKPDEQFFTPAIEQADFTSNVFSVYGQFRYRWGPAEWWLGGRWENHSDYAQSFTSSLGGQAPLGDSVRVKLAYGTAFRSPFSQQLVAVADLEQEQIRTLSGRLLWRPEERQSYTLTLFHSYLTHHRSEDPYGGLSQEVTREIYGAELDLQWSLTSTISLGAGLTWLAGDSGNEDYEILAFSIIRPDGSREDVFESWSQPFDMGPDWQARLSLDWTIKRDSNLLVTVSTGGDLVGSYNKDSIREHYQAPTLVSLTYNRPGFLPGDDRISLRLTNLLDEDYQQPDVYGPVEGPPFSATLRWSWQF